MTIKLTAREETNFLILHGRDLNISSYSLHDKYRQPYHIHRHLYYPKNQQFHLSLSDTLRRGSNYTLFIKYRAALKEGLDGLYLSSYKNNGVKR